MRQAARYVTPAVLYSGAANLASAMLALGVALRTTWQSGSDQKLSVVPDTMASGVSSPPFTAE